MDKTRIGLFREIAAAHPDNIALIRDDRIHTYARVDRLSSAIARCINGPGLERDDGVGVFIPRSEYRVITSLGALRSGCAYRFLNPDA